MYSSVNVHNYLQELDIPHEMFKFPERAASIEQAALAAGLEAHQVARVGVYRIDGKAAIVITPADREVDIEKLKRAAGAEAVEPVQSEEISSVTGYVSWSVPPVALKTEMPAYIDYYTIREDVVYTGSGEPTAILKIRSYDLVRATDGETVDVILDM